jgi:hypothetical protein
MWRIIIVKYKRPSRYEEERRHKPCKPGNERDQPSTEKRRDRAISRKRQGGTHRANGEMRERKKHR